MRQALPDDRLAEAMACAEAADVVIVCVGLDATLEGEGGDKHNEFSGEDKDSLELPESQTRLLKAVEKTGKPFVTVIAAGSALNVTSGNAILMAWYSGQAGGSALADILFGAVSPSGCLPVTFYHHVNDLPAFTDYSMKNRTYRYYEGAPLYPFGYGLTYTHFQINSADYTVKEKKLVIRAQIQNIGDYDSECVIQCYSHAHSKWAEPNPKLCGFRRIMLHVQETRKIEFIIDIRALMVVNELGQHIFDCSDYDLYIGFGQPDKRTFELTGNKPVCLSINLNDSFLTPEQSGTD